MCLSWDDASGSFAEVIAAAGELPIPPYLNRSTEESDATDYQTVFYDRDGREKPFDRQNSNLYLRGERQAPANVTVIGGKTGTTNAAGYCLMLFSRDENGHPYISIVLRAEGAEALYDEMTDLLDEIHK